MLESNVLAIDVLSSIDDLEYTSVIQALKEIGLNNQTPTEEEKIIELLKKEDPKNLIHDIKIAPVWIQKIMQKAL